MENSSYGQKRALSACARRSYCYFELSWHMSWWTLPHGVFTCVSSISSPPTLFSAHSNLVSSLPLYLWPQNATKSNGWLSVPTLLGSPPRSSVPFLSSASLSLHPLCLSSCSFLAPFDFLFLQCPLNDNLSLSVSLSLSLCLSVSVSLSYLSGALVFLTLHVP